MATSKKSRAGAAAEALSADSAPASASAAAAPATAKRKPRAAKAVAEPTPVSPPALAEPTEATAPGVAPARKRAAGKKAAAKPVQTEALVPEVELAPSEAPAEIAKPSRSKGRRAAAEPVPASPTLADVPATPISDAEPVVAEPAGAQRAAPTESIAARRERLREQRRGGHSQAVIAPVRAETVADLVAEPVDDDKAAETPALSSEAAAEQRPAARNRRRGRGRDHQVQPVEERSPSIDAVDEVTEAAEAELPAAALPAAPVLKPLPEAPVAPPAPARFRHSKVGGAGLFGGYTLQALEGDETVSITLRGAAPGYYHCSCAAFAASDEGRCAHSEELLATLAVQGEAQRAQLQRGFAPLHSEVWLSAGAERRLLLRAGSTAPEALQALSAELPAEGLSAERQVDFGHWLQLAAEAGHELRVDAAVWTQLAHGADTMQRVLRLEAQFPHGPAEAALQASLRQPLYPHQWEAALFAVCAGRALIADDLGLSQRATALAALQLWQQQFGLRKISLLAPLDRHPAWREEADRLLGGWPEGLELLTPATLESAAGAKLLIVDAVQQLSEVASLRPLDAPALLLLADRELLGEPLLGELVDWLDSARRGPWAAWRSEGRQAAKRRQRELLATVMLSRRKRDLLDSLPLSFETLLPVAVPGLALDAAALSQLQALQVRWQTLGFLSASDQLQLLQALAQLRQQAVGDAACAAKAEALLALLPQILPAQANKLVVFAQQDASLSVLNAALASQGLPVANLRRHQSLEVREQELAAWQGEDAQILLASDAACAGLDLVLDDVAVVHADLPWNPAQRAARLQRVAGAARGLPGWQMLASGSLDEALLQAQSGAGASANWPAATLDFEVAAMPFLQAEALQGLMTALAAVLKWLSPAADAP
ncbi:helicase-related protein [Paucibacter sp. APW11]|uniref:Helicase-related protein n=1 Tax=Roseateles aquae TaxID=3077235 RepID=A0ABU3P6B1_9BURK|nr:helicase-related protein [Paucibacter sp. APW11]MDT8998109.1 helicase-related protein [Paucibacter sp. APW11]